MKRTEFILNAPVAIEDYAATSKTMRLRGIAIEPPYKNPDNGIYYAKIELDESSARLMQQSHREYPLFRLKHYNQSC